MELINTLLSANKSWAARQLEVDETYFDELAKDQKPDFLWIGCSDSRVPAEDLTGSKPGEMFVHRNVANLVVHTDMNMLSVLSYAVEVLNVEHIIVCGHYGCGGIQAAMNNKSFGLIDNWLRHIKDVYRMHMEELEQIGNEEGRYQRLVELNVKQQVYNLCKTSIVQSAWSKKHQLFIHGWVYSIHDGILRDLDVTFSDNQSLSHMYKFDGN